jgi:hypothetical protein
MAALKWSYTIRRYLTDAAPSEDYARHMCTLCTFVNWWKLATPYYAPVIAALYSSVEATGINIVIQHYIGSWFPLNLRSSFFSVAQFVFSMVFIYVHESCDSMKHIECRLDHRRNRVSFRDVWFVRAAGLHPSQKF